MTDAFQSCRLNNRLYFHDTRVGSCRSIADLSYVPFQVLLRVVGEQICAFMSHVSSTVTASGHERRVFK